MHRRTFLATTGAAGFAPAAITKPAILGGTPIRREPFPSWPVFDQQEEQALLKVLRSGRWNRASAVERFEAEYARLLGTTGCLATANGTSALVAGLAALNIGPGQEVIVPPYTFVATINAVLTLGATPVFADTDPETFQIDAASIESRWSTRTAAILPVHLGGNAADIDAVLAIAKKRNVPVLEDACQAHLGEWKGRKVGGFGAAGTFSFQASKNLNSGEGGALVSNDAALIERAYTFHNNGRGRKASGLSFRYDTGGLNLRLTEFQAALLLAQMSRVEAQTARRIANARYLTDKLAAIPGVRPARQYDGCTRNAYHLYMFRYSPESFHGLTRTKFLAALQAEGIPASGGYAPLNREPFIENFIRRQSGANAATAWKKNNSCPRNDALCEGAVWLTQTMLLGPREDMDAIASAVARIHAFSGDVAKS
jgi:dTDP-4-amino-4,6-dideoxygalactose transaminase